MSYCRWSTDCYQCDVYVYESVYDCWEVHVASRRHHNPTLPLVRYEDFESGDATGLARWWNSQRDWLRHPDTTLIDLPKDNPHVDQSYYFDTPGEAADMLETIRDSGLNVPKAAIEALREEQTELDTEDTSDA